MEIPSSYWAAFMDCEGCISIHKQEYRFPLGYNFSPAYNLQVMLTNTYRPILEIGQLQYNGNIVETGKNNGYIKACFLWYLRDNFALRFLEDIYTWLMIKREQAEIAIEFQKHKSQCRRGARLSEDELSYRENVYLAIKRLNQKIFAYKGQLQNVGELRRLQ